MWKSGSTERICMSAAERNRDLNTLSMWVLNWSNEMHSPGNTQPAALNPGQLDRHKSIVHQVSSAKAASTQKEKWSVWQNPFFGYWDPPSSIVHIISAI
jgi:hypothetical protein